MSIIYSGGSPIYIFIYTGLERQSSLGKSNTLLRKCDVALRACARFQSISPHPPGQSVARIKYQLVGIAHSCAGLWL